MTTYPWVILSLLVVAAFSTAATAAPPAAQPPNEFVVLKAQGDRARLGGRLSEAREHYDKALAIHFDPVVAGRLGLVRVALRDFDVAAGLLYVVLNDPSASLSKSDRLTFTDAYANALREVCRVDIKVDQANEHLVIEIDNVVRKKGRAEFWLFLKPGTHVIRAKLQGFQDAVEVITLAKGCSDKVVVELHLEPISLPRRDVTMALAKQSHALVEQIGGSIEKHKTTVDVGSLYDAKPPPNPLKTSVNDGFVLGGGVWIPFGVTSAVGVGGQLHAGWRSRSWWEIGGDVRLAATLENEFLVDKSSVIWAFALAPCGHLGAHFVGCVLVQVNGGIHRAVPSWVLPAVGIRGGYEFHPSERFRVRVFVDGTVHLGTLGSANADPTIWGKFSVVPALGISALRFF